MRTLFKTGVLLGATVLVAGCLSSAPTNNRPTPTRDTTDSVDATDTQAAAMTYEINEEAAAGEIVHMVTSVEVLEEIPESYTLPEWDLIKEALPADEGFQWVHVTAEVTNNSKQSSSVDSTNVYVVDAEGNQFSVSTDTTIYVEDGKSPVYISVQPTQTVEWDGYFMVPTEAEDLALVGNDLSFLPESEVQIDLGL